MAEQVRKQREKREDNKTLATPPAPVKKDEKKKADVDIDEILAEIDEIIEQDAEEFVKNYVQQGGE